MDSSLFVHTASLPCLQFGLLLASGWNFLHLSPTDWSFILRSNITSFCHWLHSLDMNSISLDFHFVVVPTQTAMSPILSFLRSETMTRSSCVVSLEPTKRWYCQFPRMYMGCYYFLCAVLLNCFWPIQYFHRLTQHTLIWIWIYVQSHSSRVRSDSVHVLRVSATHSKLSPGSAGFDFAVMEHLLYSLFFWNVAIVF